ncbi:MAG: phosphopantothenoylcysteine decarboxylase, partial [Candidatus Zixiibacteriota bacterium]
NGAETTLISGPTNIEAPQKVKIITIESTEELFHTVKKEFKKADCLIMAAAPADYMPEKKAPRKIKKSNYNYKLTLNPTVDILKEISSIKQRSQFVVGFALETENGISNARKKLKEKKLDMIILNQPGANSGFESETNKVTVLRPHEEPIEIPLMTKQKIAAKLLDIISEML